MNNLRLYKQHWCNVKDISNIKYLCVDVENPEEAFVWCNNSVYQINQRDSNYKLIWCGTEEHIPVGMEFLSVTRILSIATENGDLLEINVDSCTMEEAGSCEGLTAMAWSPDQEIVVLVTNTLSVVLMTSVLTPISETTLTDVSFGEQEFITVGWGKKETQFHGSAGKAAAKAKPIEIDEVETLDRTPKISWRGEGDLFCIGFVGPLGRTFKVFNREGILQYTAEKTGGLGPSLSWRPSGNLIATTQTLPNKYIVAFFEKNGLRHGDFTLPFKSSEAQVERLSWSNDSEILCVHAKYFSDGSKVLLLYTMANYYWYLKQTLNFDAESGPLDVQWDTGMGKGKTLHIFTEDGTLATYRYESYLSHSSGLDNTDSACVAVIDVKKILFTNFRGACIPPPMAGATVVCNNFINDVVFAPENINVSKNVNSVIDSNCFFVVLSDGRLSFYKPHFTPPAIINDMQLIGTYAFDYGNDLPKLPQLVHHWMWLSESTILCTYTDKHMSNVVVINVCNLGSDDCTIVVTDTHAFDDIIISVENMQKSETALIQLQNGELYECNINSGSIALLRVLQLPCLKIKAREINNNIYTFALNERNRFYINDIEISNNISSFFLHSEFLLMTTLQHTLFTVELNQNGISALLNNKSLNIDAPDCVSTRRLERGSKIVIAVPKDTRTVLQLPRGNLEAIQPRSLSLYLIASFLDNIQYKQAFELLRKQRINLNLIFDHDPQSFLKHVDKFINDVTNPTWISLFLSELQDDDVTKTMYAASYTQRQSEQSIDKITLVCNRMREVMESRTDSENLLLPILTTYVKKHTVKDMEAALLKVKEVKDMETNTKRKLNVTADDALKYLLYLVDVNELYDVALGLYDFDIVMFVANKSQKDPKEYLPFLNDLRKLETHYRYYSIDKHLKRYTSALKHITKCQGDEKFIECLQLIKDHNLYKEGLQLFARSDERYNKVALAYGEYLKLSRKYTEAGLLFARSGDDLNALECFKQAVEWQQSIMLAKNMRLDIRQISDLCSELVVLLRTHRRFAEAATILLDHLNDLESAVAVLVEGHLWSDAFKACELNKRADIIETHIRPGLVDYISHLCGDISSLDEQFTKHSNRLLILNTQRALKATQIGQGDGFADDEPAVADCDLYSDTSSVAGSQLTRSSRSSRSSGSGRTFRSSKNRRKHERKLISLKEGSAYERPALITALHGIVVQTFNLRNDVHGVCKAALYLEWDDKAKILQNSLASLLIKMQNGFASIWTPELLIVTVTDSETTTNAIIDTAMNSNNQDLSSEHLEQHLRFKPILQNIDWEFDILK